MKIFKIILTSIFTILVLLIVLTLILISFRSNKLKNNFIEVEKRQYHIVNSLNEFYVKLSELETNDSVKLLINNQKKIINSNFNENIELIDQNAFKINNYFNQSNNSNDYDECSTINDSIESYNEFVKDFNKTNRGIFDILVTKKILHKNYPSIIKVKYCTKNEDPSEVPKWMQEIEKAN